MNNLASLEEIAPLFVCPRCSAELVRTKKGYSCTNVDCVYSQDKDFGFAGPHPVLVDFDQSILEEKKAFARGDDSPLPPFWQPRGLKRILENISLPVSAVAAKESANLLSLVKEMASTPTVLVIGGGAQGSGLEALYGDPDVRLIGFDIYGSPLTQFIADAHQIPLRAQSVHAVIIQAVLEHVLNPWRVVTEIYRVLKTDGLVYADTPFLAHVHAGPYDFTRFTESGHRYLFRDFAHIESGVVSGLGTQLLWTVEYVARGVFRSFAMGLILRTMLFWLRFLDRITSPKYAVDGAFAVFFLGRKSKGQVSPKEMVDYYKGAQHR
jgi:SAM-dependent methyltransferase